MLFVAHRNEVMLKVCILMPFCLKKYNFKLVQCLSKFLDDVLAIASLNKMSPNAKRNYAEQCSAGPSHRVPTRSGNHGKPGKSQEKVPCMEKSWNFEKPEYSWKNHGIL